MPTLETYKEKILRFYRQRRRMPSYAEIMRLLGFKSKFAVVKLVQKLVAAGIVAKDAQGRLVPRNLSQALPVLGMVEAGWPSPAEEELIDTITLDEYLIQNKEATFMARVKGDSMTGVGIMPGDQVLVQRGLEPKNDNIVIATLDGETTIKRYRKVGSRVLLIPENKKYKPIEPRDGQELRSSPSMTTNGGRSCSSMSLDITLAAL